MKMSAYNYEFWQPVEKRIIFKILLMTYKTLNGLAPCYLTTLITRYHPTRKLHSSTRSTLQVPRVKTSTYGNRAFSSAAQKLLLLGALSSVNASVKNITLLLVLLLLL